MARTFIASIASIGLLLSVAPAGAEWKVYGSAELGISIGDADIDGKEGVPAIGFSGQDKDSAPILGGTIGLEVPLDELVPREWLLDVRLPDWPVRSELEVVGFRRYDLKVPAVPANSNFFARLEVWTMMNNFWLDVPMNTMYKPVRYLFGLGRQPRVRRYLDPASFYLGAGIGFAAIEIEGTDNVVRGSDDLYNFVYQVGAGFQYKLSDRISVQAGYRFLDMGDMDVDLKGSGQNNEYSVDPYVHELRTGLRVEFYDFPSPWR